MSSGPTAPSLQDIQPVKGYENVTFEEALIQPPVAPDWHQERPPQQDISALPSLTQEDVRDAVLQHVSEQCCYGKGTAREMAIPQINMISAYHYTLETCGEKRETAWRYVPYKGQIIDGPENGPAPGPWDIDIRPSQYFINDYSKHEVPHTAFVKPCYQCVGNGRVRCYRCSGYGQETCTWCHGSGRRNSETCTWCSSSGHTRCLTCHATGQVICSICDGTGSLKGFVQLTVTWMNHLEDFISDTSKLPSDKIREVSGMHVFQEENPRVWPIMNSGNVIVDNTSKALVEKHDRQFPTERILKQRQSLRVIPVAEAFYQWKDKSGPLYVYGFENKVFFEKYPQRCCCCCAIM